MFVAEQQNFLGAMTMVTAAGVLRVQSPFSAIPLPAFPGGAGSRLLALPALSVNEWPVNRDVAASATANEQPQTITSHDGVHVKVLGLDMSAFH